MLEKLSSSLTPQPVARAAALKQFSAFSFKVESSLKEGARK